MTRAEKREAVGLPVEEKTPEATAENGAAAEPEDPEPAEDFGAKRFNPNQPRVPRGNPDGGEWTDASFKKLVEENGETFNDAVPWPESIKIEKSGHDVYTLSGWTYPEYGDNLEIVTEPHFLTYIYNRKTRSLTKVE